MGDGILRTHPSLQCRELPHRGTSTLALLLTMRVRLRAAAMPPNKPPKPVRTEAHAYIVAKVEQVTARVSDSLPISMTGIMSPQTPIGTANTADAIVLSRSPPV